MKFEECVFRSYPTGSRAICNPAPKDTDNDTVILVNGFYDWAQLLIEDGWEDCGKYDKGGDFRAFRKGEENYICTENEKFFLNYVKATDAARALNLLKKEDRISVFQAVMDASEGYVGLVGQQNQIFQVPLGDRVILNDGEFPRAWNRVGQVRIPLAAFRVAQRQEQAAFQQLENWQDDGLLAQPVGFNIMDDEDGPEAIFDPVEQEDEQPF